MSMAQMIKIGVCLFDTFKKLLTPNKGKVQKKIQIKIFNKPYFVNH